MGFPLPYDLRYHSLEASFHTTTSTCFPYFPVFSHFIGHQCRCLTFFNPTKLCHFITRPYPRKLCRTPIVFTICDWWHLSNVHRVSHYPIGGWGTATSTFEQLLAGGGVPEPSTKSGDWDLIFSWIFNVFLVYMSDMIWTHGFFMYI